MMITTLPHCINTYISIITLSLGDKVNLKCIGINVNLQDANYIMSQEFLSSN